MEFTYQELARLNQMVGIALMSGKVEFDEISESVHRKVTQEIHGRAQDEIQNEDIGSGKTNYKKCVAEKPGTYVSERVVNIKELENYIETAHLEVASLLAEMKRGMVPDTFLITKRLNAINSVLEKAYEFEFCVERRTTLCR